MIDGSDKKADSEPTSSLDAVIEVYMKDVDRTLLRENLKLTVQQRFEKFESFMRFAEELQAAGRRGRGS